MTARRGIVHSERTPAELRAADGSRLFGIQIWVALPKDHEETEPTFAHHGAGALPVIEAEGKRVRLIAGSLYGARAPVEVFSDMFYAGAELSAAARIELPPDHEERAIYVAEGRIEVAGNIFDAGRLLVFGRGEAITADTLDAARVLLLEASRWTDRVISGGISYRSRRSASNRPRATGRPGVFRRCPARPSSFRCLSSLPHRWITRSTEWVRWPRHRRYRRHLRLAT